MLCKIFINELEVNTKSLQIIFVKLMPEKQQSGKQ